VVVHAQEPAGAPSKPAALAEPAASEKTPKRTRASGEEDDRSSRTHLVAKALPTSGPTPVAAATPIARPGFFQRVFGKKPVATPTPAPSAATPTPKPKPKVTKPDDDDDEPAAKHRKPPEKASEKPATEAPATESPAKPEKPEKPEKVEGEKPPEKTATKATPTPKGRKGGPKEAVKSAPKDLSKEQHAVEEAKKSGNTDALEKAKYEYARVRAGEDKDVQLMKAKADAATSEEEGRKALRAYNRELFDKMRKLDPSITDRIDRTEAAVLRHLGATPE
jgi:hypothetical protein